MQAVANLYLIKKSFHSHKDAIEKVVLLPLLYGYRKRECERETVFVSPAEGVTGLVSRIGTDAATCRSAASSQWTPQPIYSNLTTEGKTNQCLNKCKN